MTSLAGTWPARAVEGDLDITNNGTEQIAVRFVLTDGEHKGSYITWYGFFTEKTTERTLESLRHCGWQGDDLTNLDGITENDVELVIEDEEGQDGEWRSRVRWVNQPGGRALKSRMDEATKAAFAAKMRGTVVAHRQKTQPSADRREQRKAPPPANVRSRREEPPPHGDDDIPF